MVKLYKIKFLKDTELKKVGDIVNCSKQSADDAINAGIAEYIEQPTTEVTPKVAKPKKQKIDPIVAEGRRQFERMQQGLEPIEIKEENTIKNPSETKVETTSQESKQEVCVTSNTPNTGDTSNTSNTTKENYIPVLPVLCDKETLETLFEQDLPSQIMRVLFMANKALSNQNLALQLKKDEANIRQAISRKKAYFGKIGSRGQICHNFLSQLAIDEIFDRIDTKLAQIEHFKVASAMRENALKKAKKYEEDLNTFARLHPPERDGRTIRLDFKELVEFDNLIADNLLNEPMRFIEAYKKAFTKDYEVEVVNLPSYLNIPIERIRKENLNKLVTVEGRITSFGEVKPVITSIDFTCTTCGTVSKVPQNYRDGSVTYPKGCICSKPKNEISGRQEVNACFLQLEDLQEKTDNPRSQRIKAVIFNGLCEPENIVKFSPGNEIRCTGLLKEVPIKKAGKKTLFLSWILEIWNAELIEKEIEISNFTEEEAKRISDLSKTIDEKGLSIIAESFAPDVHGYDKIKEALILQLCNKRNDPKKAHTKNKSNILLIGDPGTAKSVMCDFAVDITNGARKAVGGGSSAVGITASVQKEEESLGGYGVEPGAMVLAKELLFIDELNNLPEDDKPKLQEGMESQSITINKANIHVKMKVTSGVISAANPKGGHFILSGEHTMEEQFNITTPILNRFDTIFVMMDNIDEESDSKIASKMIRRHQGKLNIQYDKDFLRKFFTYIRAFQEPIITEECGQIMNKAYCLARKNNNGRIKLNARFLNGLTRMVIASAKLRQSIEVSKKDIERAIQILAESEFKVNPYIINKL